MPSLSRPILLDALLLWAESAERWWHPDPRRPGHGWYGTGYNNWGVQTNQKYLAAMAAIAAYGPEDKRAWATERARAALRFSLSSHLSGDGTCSDGTSWGHTWISALGIERMMYGVRLLEPALDAGDIEGLRRVLISEADGLTTGVERSGQRGVVGDLWAASGRNAPESNLWNGALLWRVAASYPDHPRVGRWREQALLMLANSLSLPADEFDPTMIDGAPVKSRFRGANFFPHYGLDHHGYFNVGYMVICVSNAAILHFDLAAAGLQAPDLLHRHQAELWSVIRKMVFADGRLARVGGDSRVRYAYCQEYLLPALLYAADRLGDEFARDLAGRQLELIRKEQTHSAGDGFYGRRLAPLARSNPYYYTRLESDRACTIGFAATYLTTVDWPQRSSIQAFGESAAGRWSEPEHGSVLVRGTRRLASFSWRAHGLAQGLCQPPDDGHLAEWLKNLGGHIRLLGDDKEPLTARRLLNYEITEFDGGFVTIGAVVEGAELAIPEGWTHRDGAISWLAIAALPDDRTMVGLHLCRSGSSTVYPLAVEGLRLNVPNDLYNDFSRTLRTHQDEFVLKSPPENDAIESLNSRWVAIDGRIGAAGIYGADTLSVHRARSRRGAHPDSLYVDRICYSPDNVVGTDVRPNGGILDIGWAVLAGPTVAETETIAATATTVECDPALRAVMVPGADGSRYLFVASLGADAATLPADHDGIDLSTGCPADRRIDAGQARLIRLGPVS